MNAARKRILNRAMKGLAALVVGAVASAIASPSFREFVGDGPLGVLILAIVPPLVLAADKAIRDRKAIAGKKPARRRARRARKPQ